MVPLGSSLVLARFHVSAWFQVGCSFVPAWFRACSSLVPAWNQLGSVLYLFVASLVPAWVQAGSRLVLAWFQLCSKLVPLGSSLACCSCCYDTTTTTIRRHRCSCRQKSRIMPHPAPQSTRPASSLARKFATIGWNPSASGVHHGRQRIRQGLPFRTHRRGRPTTACGWQQ